MDTHLEIPLYNRRRGVVAVTLVDAEDQALAEHRWHRGGHGYARRFEAGKLISMHRVILGLRDGDPRQGDHINRDRLDNRRSNLRIVTRAQNLQNKSAHRNSTSRFRGVHWDQSKNRWRACARLNRVQYKLGTFTTEYEAALAVERWRAENMPFSLPDPQIASGP